MARIRQNSLPRYLECHPLNKTYYYKNPAMSAKANLGKDHAAAIRVARSLNLSYQIQIEQQAARLEASIDFGGAIFKTAFAAFVDKYIGDYQLKPSTAQLLRQRQQRLEAKIGEIQIPALTTQILRESICGCSQFEQTKMRTLLSRFFRYAKSTGGYPSHLSNPVDDLFVDPIPPKQRHRITLQEFRAVHAVSPAWLQWLMTLALHLALRRVDLVNLRFDDIVGDRIVSRIRKTDTQARGMDATSVDFPLHPDVRKVINEARISSIRLGRSPYIIHRAPTRTTARVTAALAAGRLEHPTQVLPDYASKAFADARRIACDEGGWFTGLAPKQLPTIHEIRSLSSHLYARAGFTIDSVQDLMAHTDPDMTRAYQKGHARKVLRVEMMLPWSVNRDEEDVVRERSGRYVAPEVALGAIRPRENSLIIF
jgi:enterobacteria phage integrase